MKKSSRSEVTRSERGMPFGGIPHSQDLKVFEAVFEDVGHPVITGGISRDQQEAGPKHVGAGVVNDTFHDFFVIEFNPHPETRSHWSVSVKMERIMTAIAVERLHQENRLGVFQGQVFDRVGVDPAQSNRMQLRLRAPE